MCTKRETVPATNGLSGGHFESKLSDSKIDYNSFFTPVAKARIPNYLKIMGDKMLSIQGRAYKFSTGSPNPECFPYEELTVKLKTGVTFQIKGQQLNQSLNYMQSSGYQPLLDLLKSYQDLFHGDQDWEKKDLSTTSGSLGGLHQLLEICVAPGDPVLVQSPLYTGVISVLHPLNVEFIEVESGAGGICTQRLANTLHERRKRNLPMPKVFYLNPVGSNPTGEIISVEKKREIYKLACEYNLLIFEDDAYFFLTFNSEFPRSFLSMDTENRVVRFDTISKTIGAGLRTGYVTAPKEIIAKLDLVKGSSNYCTPFGQVVVYETLKSMGLDGFMSHVNFIQNFYYEHLKIVIKCLDKYFSDVATWNIPGAGLFVWLTIKNVDHISDGFINKCLKELVFVVPGFSFYGKNRLSPNLRLCFSLLEKDEIEEGMEILARLVKEEIVEQMNNKYKTKYGILPK
ncbi:kynurenine/alpha-aminoadipate aminotransferase, mitochondrial-like [Planococcus citri]|uniref:kynurenine/alpha-aminoadipate aminotransferase, mitochondrial-like n=1 Tax=Planococcus citri TaxID=170843 RepID=UPI0031F9FC8B